MGDPWFKIKHLQHSHGLIALSANFALYGDLSQRMMSVIGQFSPLQEIYSIDESFLDLTGIPGTGRQLGTEIRNRVMQWVGIPTCVGIGPTKTLAKLANHLAKKIPRLQGVCDLSAVDHAARLKAMRHVPVDDVWGVGRKLAPQLNAMGIHSASDLAQASVQAIQNKFSVVLSRTVAELAGVACIPWEDSPPEKQQIICSRSFGAPVEALADLQHALATFMTRASEKLRSQHSLAGAAQVFIRTSHFRQGPQHSGSVVTRLHPTDNTSELIHAALGGLGRIYKPGYAYAKAGVCLLDIEPAQPAHHQLGLFSGQGRKEYASRSNLMTVMDKINHRYGRSTVVAASALASLEAPWRMRQERMTPAYTTDWNDIVQIWR